MGEYAAALMCLCPGDEVTDVPEIPIVPGYTRSTFSVRSPIGGGLIRPFRRTERADFLNGDGVPEVMSNLGQVLGTVRGSLPWNLRFGSDLHQLRHRPVNAVSELARQYVLDAAKWEPRAEIVDVTVDDPGLGNTLVVRVFGRILGDISRTYELEFLV